MTNKLLWVLRGLFFIVAAVLMMKPVVTRPDPSLPSAWAVLVDTSRSMRVQDQEMRLAAAQRLLPMVRKSFPRTQLFSFSDRVTELKTEADVKKLEATGSKTDMASALKTVLGEDRFRGAVLLTDGRQVGSGDPVSAAAAAGRPLLLIGLGNKQMFKDIAVRHIQAPPFAFKNIQTSLAATIAATGFEGKDISVKLRDGDDVLSLQQIHVTDHEAETTVNFSWTPPRIGTKNLTVEVGQYAGEATFLNNKRDITLDVGRDRFRVLYICGQPGPEYGFLRHQFKADPAVELVTFVILRNAGNIVSVPDSELSLIPFPTQEALVQQMPTFDLVVFEEFSYRQYGLMPGIMEAIRRKVEGGGSFLLMGGPVVFGAGSDYALPGSNELLPVQFGSMPVKTTEETFRFVPKALSHPILRLDENPERNKKMWEGLPPLDGLTILPGVKPGATVLGTALIDGKEAPVLTVWRVGKGRVGALSTRTTWRWSMIPSENALSFDSYQQFWKNMVLWLTHSDEFKPVRMAFDEKNIKEGEEQALRIWVYDDYFKPLSGVDVRVEVTLPDGKKGPLPARQETTGVYSCLFKPDQLGAFTIKAWAFRGGNVYGDDKINVQVKESHNEEEDLRPDFSLLNEMAKATGGRFLTAEDVTESSLNEFHADVAQNVGKKVLVWNSPVLLLLGLLFLTVELFLRKKKGLP